MRRFEFVEGTSARFWEVESRGDVLIVRFGKLGAAGQTKEKAFPSADAASCARRSTTAGRETCPRRAAP